MSVFDEWAKYVVNVLKAESKYAGALVQHPVLLGDAREALVQGVLSRILPNAYEIGRGQLIDSYGKRSNQIDIVIARRDSPALTLASGAKVFLIESVIATIEVKSHLKPKTLAEALDNCSSVGELQPKADKDSYLKVMKERGFQVEADGTLHHDSELELQRASIIGYPATYVFGFKGYKTSFKSLAITLRSWAKRRIEKGTPSDMRHVPSVIATEGCIAFRNASPFGKPRGMEAPNCLMWVGKDSAPLRMLIAHLLYTIQSKVPWVPDSDGIQSDPSFYLVDMEPWQPKQSVLCKNVAAAEPATAIDHTAPESSR